MPPIRVLQIMPAMDAGGMETFVMNVYRTIDREKVATHMLELGVVEQVIPEEKEFSLTYAKLQEELEAALSQLGQLPVEELLEQRYQRFRKY